MEREREPLAPIGRFSPMTRLSVKALRHHDELGLLPPAEIDPNRGYRYHRLGQANEAEAIRILRSLGVPLAEIGEVLGADGHDVVAKLVERHRRRIEDELDERRRRKRFIEALLDSDQPSVTHEVATRVEPDVALVSIRAEPTWTTMHDEIADGFAHIVAAIAASGAAPTDGPLIVFHTVIDEDHPGDIEICVPVEGELPLDPSGDGPRSQTLPGGTVASTVHRGPYEELAPAYHVLEGWIHRHGHRPVGSPRERYLDDPSTTTPDQRTTEVPVPIA